MEPMMEASPFSKLIGLIILLTVLIGVSQKLVESLNSESARFDRSFNQSLTFKALKELPTREFPVVEYPGQGWYYFQHVNANQANAWYCLWIYDDEIGRGDRLSVMLCSLDSLSGNPVPCEADIGFSTGSEHGGRGVHGMYSDRTFWLDKTVLQEHSNYYLCVSNPELKKAYVYKFRT